VGKCTICRSISPDMWTRRTLMRGLAGLAALPLAACAAAPIPQPQRPRATSRTVTVPADFGLDTVIDINHANQVSDFAQLRRGVQAVIHKASEGNDWFDPLYARRRQQAEAVGLLWGAYHFGTRQHPGAEQAAAFLAAAKPGPATLLALDLELNERWPANSMQLGQAEDFVATVLWATGRLPLLYVQPAWADGAALRGQSLGGAIGPGSILARCDLWLADYRDQPELPLGWAGRGWQLWQYAGDGGHGPFADSAQRVAGVDRCDRNLFFGDDAALGRWWVDAAV